MKSLDEATRAAIESTAHEPELLARAEQDGYEQMKARYETAQWIASQSSTTLTVMLAGLGGALAYAVKAFEPSAKPVDKGAAVLCLYLAVLVLLLVWRCFLVEQMPAVRNEPRSWLFSPGTPLLELRRMELVRLQERLDSARQRNESKAKALNILRLLLALSPAVFGLAVWLPL